MKLNKINESEVQSTEGYNISYGRDHLTYREGDKYIIVPIEHLGDPYELAVYVDLAGHWSWRGRPAGHLNNIEKNDLVARIDEALSFLGRNFSIRR